jgi:hypothetical protein
LSFAGFIWEILETVQRQFGLGAKYIRLDGFIWQKKLAPASTNPAPKPFIVFGEHAFFTKALCKAVQQHLMGLAMCRCQAIVYPQPFLPGNHQPCFTQVGQVPGGGGLRNLQYGNEVADAQFAALKQIENPQPSSVGECPKNRLGLRLSRLGFHIRLYEYIGRLPSSQERDLGKIEIS